MALWARWTGDNLNPEDLMDSSGNGRDLANSGLTSFAESPFPPAGAAIDCDGSSSASDSSLAFPQSYSACLNFRVDVLSTCRFLVGLYSGGNSLYMGLSSNGYLTVIVGNVTLTGDYAITASSVYQVVVTVTGVPGDVTLYINDMSTAINTAATAQYAPDQLNLGGNVAGYRFDGLLGDVCIYDHALSVGERENWVLTGSLDAPPTPDAPARDGGCRFLLTLTGDADGTTDIALPMSSLNARLRSGSPSYLQVTIPYTTDFANQIADRGNGDLALVYADEIADYSVCTVALEIPQISRGVASSSIVLTGHRQTTNSDPGSHTVTPLSLQSSATATTAIVPGYSPEILPADSVDADGITYTVETISIQASVSTAGVNIQSQLVGS